MRARDSRRHAVLVRYASLAVLLAVVGMLAYQLAFRRPGPPASSPEERRPESRQAALKEGVRHLEYKDGRVWLDAIGDRAVVGSDGSTRLEGNVKIIDRRAERESELVITAASVSFDRDLSLFAFGGGVEIREGRTVLKSPSFDYDKSRGEVRSDQEVSYSSPGLGGSARSFLYDLERDVLVLADGFRLEIPGRGPDSRGSVVSGTTLRYERSVRRGDAGGGVTIRGEGFQGSAQALGFELWGGEDRLRSAEMSGKAKASLSSRPETTEETLVQSIEAEKILIDVRPGTSEISECRARGEAILSASLPGGKRVRVRGKGLRVTFEEGGNLKEFEVSEEGAAELDDQHEGGRTIEGLTVSYEQGSGILLVRGRGDRPARLVSPVLSLEARTVALDVPAEELRAAEGVKGTFVPDSEEHRIGTFEPGRPVFFRCVEFGRRSKRLEFSGEVRLWQGNEFFEAAELETDEDSGALTAEGGVRAGLVHRPKAREEEFAEISSRRMTSGPAVGAIRFAGACRLTAGEARLAADEMEVILGPGAEGVDKIEIRGNVVVQWRSAEGRSDEAFFDLGAESLVLSGRPVLQERNKGTVRGDKLTFRLADDRIFVENEGQERSVAVIKK